MPSVLMQVDEIFKCGVVKLIWLGDVDPLAGLRVFQPIKVVAPRRRPVMFGRAVSCSQEWSWSLVFMP